MEYKLILYLFIIYIYKIIYVLICYPFFVAHKLIHLSKYLYIYKITLTHIYISVLYKLIYFLMVHINNYIYINIYFVLHKLIFFLVVHIYIKIKICNDLDV